MTFVVNIVTVALAADSATGGKRIINKGAIDEANKNEAMAKKLKMQQMKKLGSAKQVGLGGYGNPLGGDPDKSGV